MYACLYVCIYIYSVQNDQRAVVENPNSNPNLKWESLSSMTYEVSVPSSSRANSTEQRLSPSMSYNALYVGDSTSSAPTTTTYRPLHLQTDDASVPDPSNMTNLLTQNGIAFHILHTYIHTYIHDILTTYNIVTVCTASFLQHPSL